MLRFGAQDLFVNQADGLAVTGFPAWGPLTFGIAVVPATGLMR